MSLEVRSEASLLESSLRRIGLKLPSELREQLVLCTVLVLFAGVFGFRIVVSDVEQPIALLYTLPITLVAVEYGMRAGLLAAGVAIALFALYVGIESVDYQAADWWTRALVFFMLGGLVGRLSDGLRSASAAFQASQAQLQAILDNATAVIYVKDSEGHYILVNRRFEEQFQVGRAQVVGKSDYDLFPTYSSDQFRAADRKVMKTGQPLEIEEVVPQSDGQHTYISIKFPVRDEFGDPYGVCGISTDITERMRVQDQLKESREQTRQIIDTAHEAFVSIDASSVVTGWNKQSEAVFGWSRAQAIGKPLTELIIPERFHAKHSQGIQRFLATGEGPVLNKRMELTARHRDGHEFPIEIAITALRTKGGHVFNAFLHDITERKRAEEMARVKSTLEHETAQLKKSNIELAQFAHVASHDLSEPLRTVARYVQLLDNRYRGKLDDDADEFIGFAVEGASRMQALVNGLRTYSTLGSAEHSPVELDSQAVVQTVLDSLRDQVEQTDASVSVGPLPKVCADPGQLAEVFYNVISNALKFVDDRSPSVQISAERRSLAWCFTIEDNGTGIKPEHRKRVFEMFKRLEPARYEGTGIGLTISRKIISRHGGRIWVEESPHGGASLRFTIADRKAEDPHGRDRSADPEPSTTEAPAA